MAYVKDQLEAFGQVALLTPGKGVKTIATIQKREQVANVSKGDTDKLIAEARNEFRTRLNAWLKTNSVMTLCLYIALLHSRIKIA